MPATATPRKPQTLARKLVETRNTSRNRGLAAMLGLGESEKELARDFGSGLNDVIGRGTLASLIGLPGDLGGLAENGIRSALGMPQVQPYGGSEHIGQKLEEAGLVSPVRRPKTELLASLISPSQAASAAYRAPQMARAGVRMLDNLADSRGMGRGLANSQVGAIDVGPQAKALRVAQQNAAKPIEEGGLGLRPDNTPEERAAAMGFDTPVYHGTAADVSEFDIGKAGTQMTKDWGDAVYLTPSPSNAGYYATEAGSKASKADAFAEYERIEKQYGNNAPETFAALNEYRKAARIAEETPQGANIMPLLLDTSRAEDYVVGSGMTDPYLYKTLRMAENNKDVARILDNPSRVSEYAVFNPSRIRSRFAAFDPMRRDSSDILAGLAPLGLGAWMYQDEPVK